MSKKLRFTVLFNKQHGKRAKHFSNRNGGGFTMIIDHFKAIKFEKVSLSDNGKC